jgi:hypothetical protein
MHWRLAVRVGFLLEDSQGGLKVSRRLAAHRWPRCGEALGSGELSNPGKF